ncbi:DUF6531 domain-containing protein [Burkholderia pyrrocinia]|uniref:RHS repeat-associated core domain-containing protein n=1 Tax=Burkholderia pyrrocinia TaxID=60550 RepID=UPI00215B3FB0|nr:RHS repeat-associated core domain-containing protein [Burkholderia pyrrocinia]UVE68342.1 DUF6531 domain-containing protein [Burkholderia pyrrocinia]
MGLPAVKHLDPVVGVDLHSVLVTPSPTPVFLPHPHIGFMLDLREYVNAALGVIGAIAFTIIEEKAVEYLKDHPDDAKQLDDAAHALSGELRKLAKDPTVAQALKGAATAGDIANAMGVGVGMGSIAGRPIFVNGMLRATAGTHAFHVPSLHFPLGESFAPPDPDPSNDSEAYMGSKTVLANNDPMAFLALPAMSCWAVGLEPPTHNGAHTKREHLSLPTSFMLPIPTGRPVLVGGPPIVNMAALAKGLFKAFRGSEWARALADKLHLKPGFLRCTVLGADPVNMITGEVVTRQHDFTVSGRLLLVWERHYAGHDTRRGAVGVGWATPADTRLELMRHAGAVGMAAHFLDHATAFDAMPDAAGWQARVYDWQHGHALYRQEDRLVLRTRAGLEYEFAFPGHRQHELERLAEETTLTLPVVRMADLNGNSWVFERGSDGGLARLIEWKWEDATGRTIECAGESRQIGGCVSVNLIKAFTLIDADGNAHLLAGYEHDESGNLIATFDARGPRHRFVHADGGRMVRHTSARGISFYYSHRQHDDGVWRVDHAWGDNGVADYRFFYDVAHRETRISNSLGHMTVLQYNERGMPVARIDALGGVSSYQYDERGRTNAETDPAGRTTRLEYDAYGNLLALALPDRGIMRTAFDSDQRPICFTDPDDNQWLYSWDERGNLRSRTLPTGAVTRYEYDRHGQVIAYVEPRGAVTRFDYDRDGNLEAATDALGHRMRYIYDALANVIQTINAQSQASHYEYDRNGNLVRAIQPGQREIVCGYDADGNLARYCDPNGRVTELEYSALGQITKQRTSDGAVVQYRYDTESQLIAVINERGEMYELRRDALGRIIEEIDYWGQTRRYEYGATGELLRSVDPLGQSIVYESDVQGRIVKKRIPDPRQPDGIRVETFQFDRSGNLSVAENPDCRVARTYDAAGRLVRENQGNDFSIAYIYDAAGNLIERRTSLNDCDEIVEHTVRYEYDVLGQASSIQIDEAAPITFERDALGRIRVEHLGEELRRELSYIPEGLLAKQTLLACTGPLFTKEYTYDANGEMLEKRDSRLGIERYQYDPIGRLIEHLDPTGKAHRFIYDLAGDLLTTRIQKGYQGTVSGDGSHTDTLTRVGEHDGCHYEFDRTGNLTRKLGPERDLALRWDGAGQLIETLVARRTPEADGPSHDMAVVQTRYRYDALGRRVSKVTRQLRNIRTDLGGSNRAELLQQTRTSLFFWDSNVLAAESTNTPWSHDEDGAWCLTQCEDTKVVRRFVYHPNTFRPLAMLCRTWQQSAPAASRSRGVTALYLIHNDSNGAPCDVTDMQGLSVWRATYSAWGKANPDPGSSNFSQPIRLQGQYDDEETGLHYSRHRYYDPAVGQFISEDPIRLLGGLNLYAYAPNIIGWADPLGLSKKKNPFEKHHSLLDLPNPMRDAIADWLRAEWNKGGDARKAIKDAGRNLGAYLYDDGKLVVVLNVKNAILHSEEVIAGEAGLKDFVEAGTLFSERIPCNLRCRSPIEGNDAIHDVLFLYPEQYAWGRTTRTWQEIQRLLANRYALIFNKHPADIVREFWHPELGKEGEFVCPDSA